MSKKDLVTISAQMASVISTSREQAIAARPLFIRSNHFANSERTSSILTRGKVNLKLFENLNDNPNGCAIFNRSG
tara:strand:- start:837 stop:1061 length:225 start_codon:yes stop_codon:yes gene_type:complete